MVQPKGLGCGVALLALATMAGCSGGGGDSPGNATLSVSLMDAPVDGVTAVYVTITSMWIKPTGGPAVQVPLVNAPLTVNLLSLTDTNAAILVNEAVIEPGSYQWLAMDIAAEPNVVDSYVMTDAGAMEEVEVDLSVPSGRLRLVSGFDVAPNQAVRLLFDWDMRQGLVYPPGQNRYFLKPAFRMLDVTEYGVLEGTISGSMTVTAENHCDLDEDPELDDGNVVYVFEGAVTPDDIGGTNDPVATIRTTRNDAGDYVYRTLIETDRPYTVAFTCQGASDALEQDDTIAFIDPVGTINPVTNDGGTTTVNF